MTDDIERLGEELSRMEGTILERINGKQDGLYLGPFIIDRLSQLRVLACSPQLQRVTLERTEDCPMNHITYSDLPFAIVDFASNSLNAFQTSNMTIASIMKEAQSTFGKNGPAQDILVALQDSGRGRRPTLALTGLMNSLNRCNDYVGKVSTDFGKIIETARELHLSMIQKEARYEALIRRQNVKEVEQAVKEANENWERELLAFTVKTDQGCDNTTLPPPSGPNSINLNSVIEQRQLEVCKRRKKLDQTLIGLISWTQTTQYIQTKMNEISCRLKELNHDQAAAGETSKAIKDGVDFLSQIESGFCRIKKTFDAFAGYIDKGIVRGSGKRLASALEDTSEHALKGQSHCSQAQARSMIDIVLEMRGQFMVVHDMGKVCLDMFHEHGMPCIQKTCWLELWDTIRKTIDSSGPSLRTH